MAIHVPALLRDRLFRGSLAATLLAFLACLATHVLTILGIAGAIAWLGKLEHALVFATGALALLTLYAWRRHHRNACACAPSRQK